MSQEIEANIQKIRERIAAAAARANKRRGMTHPDLRHVCPDSVTGLDRDGVRIAPQIRDGKSELREDTLREAIAEMKGSAMLREAFGEDVMDHYIHTAEWEQFEYDRRVTDWELKRGFERS